ncbi:MAG: phosphatidate cytidylyltransferase [Alphaproteobacteria bacterium]
MVFDINRIFIGVFILLIVIISYFLILDLLLYSLIVILIFIELKISKILNFKSIFIFSLLYFFFIFLYFNFDLYIILASIIFLSFILLSFFVSNLKYIFTILVILFTLFFFHLLNFNRDIFYLIIFISFLNDTAAYLSGKSIKGPLILSSISPKKTWSGTIFSFILSFLILIYLDHSFILSIVLSLSLFLGDLYFSYFKRKLYLKDFSSLLSSHGGIMDRLDSMFLITFIFILSISF